MKIEEELCFEKEILSAFKPEITSSTIIALEKVCFSLDIEKEQEKEFVC